MEKIDVLKLVRENQDRFKQHLQKMKELEQRDKDTDYNQNLNLNYNYNQNQVFSNSNQEKESLPHRLTTIPEGENETISAIKTANEEDLVKRIAVVNKYQPNKRKDSYIYNEVNFDSGEENEEMKEKVSKENDYLNYKREEKKNDCRSEEERSQDNYLSEEEEEMDHEQGEDQEENEENDNYSDDNNYDEDRSKQAEYHEGKNSRNSEVENNEEVEDIDEQHSDTNESEEEMKRKLKRIYDTASYSDSDRKIKKPYFNPPNLNNKINNSSKMIGKGSQKLTPKFNHQNSNDNSANKTSSNSRLNLARSNVSNALDKSANNKFQNSRISNDIQDDSQVSKRPYTAYTYSTIKKMKTNSITDEKKSKILKFYYLI
jgi:hypothetical protein